MVAFKLPWAHRPANGSAAENAPLLGAPGKPHATNRNSNLHHENGNGNYVNGLPRSRVRWESPTRHLSYGVQIPQAPGVSRYFIQEPNKRSRIPVFLQLQGSVMPKMIFKTAFVAVWSALVTTISIYAYDLSINNILLTVLGVVVGLALSFRSSTAYDRFSDGRKYWALLTQTCRDLARVIWVSVEERSGEQGKDDVLGKLTALNLILAFTIALKHKLRFEPLICYEDLTGLIGYLDTFLKEQNLLRANQNGNVPHDPRKKAHGAHGLQFPAFGAQKLIRESEKPLEQLPLEILNHISAYIDYVSKNGTLVSTHQGECVSAVATLNEVLTGTERVLETPLPAAYTIAISQITWVYVLLLPFQLFSYLGWITIPGSIVGAYIILGLSAIGEEVENPFGHDANDLPLDYYCERLAREFSVMTATPPPRYNEFAEREDNYVLYPLSLSGFTEWKTRSMKDIRAALRTNAALDTPIFTISSPVLEEEEFDQHPAPTQTV
ncbi:hypothetical protein DTO282F9_4226 [Paecilomyces variotii]|nr:hypothetical protein DTO282E5_5970 [Paecilomyces variotii]KAJ9398874.1 hypothetical protein DTO282F9_4226 [Paecilomyces variotii]